MSTTAAGSHQQLSQELIQSYVRLPNGQYIKSLTLGTHIITNMWRMMRCSLITNGCTLRLDVLTLVKHPRSLRSLRGEFTI